MPNSQQPTADEIEQLLLNARLRDELEPFCDESVELLDVRRMSTREENEFLASMLAWERAPVVPISRWFDPELVLPRPETLDDSELYRILWDTINKLYDKRIVLELTDHLSDRQLYCVILRDILPSPEKQIDRPKNYLHWHCLDDNNDPEVWLTYYASEEERNGWAEESGLPLPPALKAPHPRKMPRRPPERA
jgi:hypothetical protein